MRTTIDLDDDLLKEIKAIAARTHRTMNAVIEDAIRHSLSQSNAVERIEPFEVPVVGEGGPLPGVDLTRWASLLDSMEETDAPARR